MSEYTLWESRSWGFCMMNLENHRGKGPVINKNVLYFSKDSFAPQQFLQRCVSSKTTVENCQNDLF